jgi:hypothetical protein
MEVSLKYKHVIESRSLSIQCPSETSIPSNQEAYRFVLSPIEHEQNFLPNILYDKVRGTQIDYNKMPEDKYCSRCGISLYDTLQNAKTAYKSLTPKIKVNLGYTHVARGTLVEEDGLMKAISEHGHFGFYENSNADIGKKFLIVDAL